MSENNSSVQVEEPETISCIAEEKVFPEEQTQDPISPSASSSSVPLNVEGIPLDPHGIPVTIPRRNTTSHARKVASDHVKRPRNAFILFRSHTVAMGIIPQQIEKDHRNISVIVSIMWKALKPHEKRIWEEKAEAEKEQHKLQYPGYRYQPSVRRPNVVRRKVVQEPNKVQECEVIAERLMTGGALEPDDIKAATLEKVQEYNNKPLPPPLSLPPIPHRSYRASSAPPTPSPFFPEFNIGKNSNFAEIPFDLATTFDGRPKTSAGPATSMMQQQQYEQEQYAAAYQYHQQQQALIQQPTQGTGKRGKSLVGPVPRKRKNARTTKAQQQQMQQDNYQLQHEHQMMQMQMQMQMHQQQQQQVQFAQYQQQMYLQQQSQQSVFHHQLPPPSAMHHRFALPPPLSPAAAAFFNQQFLVDQSPAREFFDRSGAPSGRRFPPNFAIPPSPRWNSTEGSNTLPPVFEGFKAGPSASSESTADNTQGASAISELTSAAQSFPRPLPSTIQEFRDGNAGDDPTALDMEALAALDNAIDPILLSCASAGVSKESFAEQLSKGPAPILPPVNVRATRKETKTAQLKLNAGPSPITLSAPPLTPSWRSFSQLFERPAEA